MHYVSTSTQRGSESIMANYDFQLNEDHVNGTDVPEDHPNIARIHRHVTHSAWRGTGTPGAIQTGVIVEKMVILGGENHEFRSVKLQLEVDNHAVRLALGPDEAVRLAETLLYMAKVARDESR